MVLRYGVIFGYILQEKKKVLWDGIFDMYRIGKCFKSNMWILMRCIVHFLWQILFL